MDIDSINHLRINCKTAGPHQRLQQLTKSVKIVKEKGEQ